MATDCKNEHVRSVNKSVNSLMTSAGRDLSDEQGNTVTSRLTMLLRPRAAWPVISTLNKVNRCFETRREGEKTTTKSKRKTDKRRGKYLR